jgi:pyruvate/2-oxoglutarate dehydrogenase complex dihydrolipoamide acyltransferase (E2) component
MGAASKVAGAAGKAVPAARVASTVAGAANKRPGGGKDPRVTAPGSKAAQQRQAIEDMKASREPEPADAPAPVSAAPAPAPPAAPSSGGGGGFSLPGMPAAATTGSGFLLGVFAWAVGLAYLRGGMPEVRKFARAKFFNQTGG